MLVCAILRAVAAALVVALAPPAAMAADRAATAPTEWIEVHAHPIGGRGRHTDFPGAVEAAVAVMRDARITRMILMPPPQVAGEHAPFDVHDFADAVRTQGRRVSALGGGGTLNAMLHEHADGDVSDRVKARFEAEARAILDRGAIGFGEIGIHHLSLAPNHPYEAVSADHPLLRLLADIAARHDVPIDVHFDPVVERVPAPSWAASPPHPAVFEPNIEAFERLLAHNRGARFVWAHAGSDFLGHWTVDLSRRLLDAHPNLYMSLRPGPGRVPAHFPLAPGGRMKPAWTALLTDFSDRFVIGGDQFFVSDSGRGGPAEHFAKRSAQNRGRALKLLAAMPEGVAEKVATANARRIYKLTD